VLLWKIRNVLADFGRDYHVLVFDDASSDGTSATLERYQSSLPLTVLRAETRLGYGGAVGRLLMEVVRMASHPKRDVAVVMQADFTEDPAGVVPLVKVLEGGADIVAGCESENGGNRPMLVRLARWSARALMGRAYRGAPVSDPLSGFRAYRVIVLKKAFRDMPKSLASFETRWPASIDLLATLAPHARRIEETPLHLRYDLLMRESRFRPLQTVRDVRKTIRAASWPAQNQRTA